MASSPLPANPTGQDARDVVFAGCDNRPGILGSLFTSAFVSGVSGGAAGVVVGFGVTWLIARHLRAKKRI